MTSNDSLANRCAAARETLRGLLQRFHAAFQMGGDYTDEVSRCEELLGRLGQIRQRGLPSDLVVLKSVLYAAREIAMEVQTHRYATVADPCGSESSRRLEEVRARLAATESAAETILSDLRVRLATFTSSIVEVRLARALPLWYATLAGVAAETVRGASDVETVRHALGDRMPARLAIEQSEWLCGVLHEVEPDVALHANSALDALGGMVLELDKALVKTGARSSLRSGRRGMKLQLPPLAVIPVSRAPTDEGRLLPRFLPEALSRRLLRRNAFRTIDTCLASARDCVLFACRGTVSVRLDSLERELHRALRERRRALDQRAEPLAHGESARSIAEVAAEVLASIEEIRCSLSEE